MFIFLQTQTARLPQGVFSTRICASNTDGFSPVQAYSESCPTKNKATVLPLIPLNVYFFPTQTARLPQGVFSTRICASNTDGFSPVQAYSESCPTKNKATVLPLIPLNVYFFPTQTARLPQGVFSTRICASNRSANADTWEIIPTIQS